MKRTALVLALLLGAARADAAPPDDLIAQRLVLGRGGFEARLVIETNFQLRYWMRPTTFAPDAWVGLTDRLTVGVVHSDQSVDRIDAGQSFCVRESNISTCKQLYRGSGLDARYSAIETGHFALAPRVRFLVRDLDPVKPAMTIGALLRWHRGRWAIQSDPWVRIGLWNQERGNRTNISVPVWGIVQPARGVELWVHSGYDGDAAVWSDGWHMPVGVGTVKRLNDQLFVGLEAGWQSLLGPQHDYRRVIAMLTAGWRQ